MNIVPSGLIVRHHTSSVGSSAPAAAPEGRFRVASYNVENMFDDVDDPDTRDEGTPPKTPEAMRKVAETLRRSGADAVALQEVENLDVLNDFLDTYMPGQFPHRVLIEGNDSRGIDVAVISRHPIEGVTSHKDNRFDVPGQPKPESFRRDFLKVDLKVEGTPFSIYTTHFKSHGGGDRADRIRLGEATEASRIVRENMARYPGERFVVTGDFNDTPDTEVVRTLRGEPGRPDHLKDALESSSGSRITHPVTRRQIDYILYPESMGGELLGSGVMSSSREESGSDHNLLWADFQLPKGS